MRIKTRRSDVLCVNEDGSRERLCVGLSRETDRLVVVGDPEVIGAVGGPETLARLEGRSGSGRRARPRWCATAWTIEYCIYYNLLMEQALEEVARRTDLAVKNARAELVAAVRDAAAHGMTQMEIARQIGRSQPEVSRLLRFHGHSPLALKLRRHADEVRRIVTDAGGRNVRVFGSVARAADREGSDIDLLFEMRRPLSLLELGRLEQRLTELVGAPVDLVPEEAVRPDLRPRILSEAVPL